jgi:hypothetical protein
MAALLFAALATCGLPFCSVGAAQPPARGGAAPGPAGPAAGANTKYRFTERYALPGTKASPDAIGQYKVDVRETNSVMYEKPGGVAPDRSENAFRAIYSERAADASEDGEVLSTVRRFTYCRPVPDRGKAGDRRALEGFTIWYEWASDLPPIIVSMTEGRKLNDLDFVIARQQLFLPSLSQLLSKTAHRVGDTWPVPSAVAHALVGEIPTGDGKIAATLLSVSPTPDRKANEAKIRVTGTRLVLPTRGDSAFTADLYFTFPQPTTLGAAEPVVDARGAITEVLMRTKSVMPLNAPPGQRLRMIVVRDLKLYRQLSDDDPLRVPDPPPAPTQANSWLTYTDVQKGFEIDHPQNYDRVPDPQTDLTFKHFGDSGPDDFQLTLIPKTGNGEDQRELTDPEAVKARLKVLWRKKGMEPARLDAGGLADAAWAESGLSVYRIRAQLTWIKPLREGPDFAYEDTYLVTFGKEQAFVAWAFTESQQPTGFLKECEAMLKTFRPLQPAKKAEATKR